jgi:alanine dehydrogenase
MKPTATLLIDRRALASMFSMPDYIELVEHSFVLHARGYAPRPGLLHIDSIGGAFHIKAGLLRSDERPILAAKINGRFLDNGNGVASGVGKVAADPLGTVRGAILVFDATTGYPLALMDSTEITTGRTGAATAVAAKYLARRDSAVATICGSGVQARAHVRAMQCVLPLERVYVWGRNDDAVHQLARELMEQLSIEVLPTENLRAALRASDVCVTCTPATEFFVRLEDVPPGMFIAAIGADSPGKQELDPRLLAAGRLVVDVLEQCAAVGELQHGMRLGLVDRACVHAELGEIVAGTRQGRTSRDELTIFDSTGTAFQDAIVAGAAYQRALESGAGTFFDFFTA